MHRFRIHTTAYSVKRYEKNIGQNKVLQLGSADLLSLVTTAEKISSGTQGVMSFNSRRRLHQPYRVNSFTSSSHLLHPVEQTPSTKSTLSTIFSKAVNCFILLIRNRGHNSTQLLPFLHNYFLHIKVFFEKSLKVSSFSENNILNT